MREIVTRTVRRGLFLAASAWLTAWAPLSAQQTATEEGAADAAAGAPAESLRTTFDPERAFAPLPFPEPSEVRAASGAPGPGYWQQRADYAIEITLDARANHIAGRERITYTNNSPDSLRSLWLQLDQNLFREDSWGAERAPEDARHGGFFDDGGFELGRVTLERDEETVVPEYRVEDTMMEILLERPLAPGGHQVAIDIEFAFEIPESGADRMGYVKVGRAMIYELAQWYPRMFAYDDVHGWNQMPYLGQGEWYLEYGDFDVEITVPREYVVMATGVLQNETEVLTEEQRSRLARARRSAEAVMIIDAEEAGDESTRPAGEGPLTWRFRAENVRDFAWAASDGFVWDAASWEDVLLMSAYPEESIGAAGFTGWERSTEYLRHSIAHYSEKWSRYPYPVAINVAGVALGMEYPMIVFCAHQARGAFLFAVTDHEIGHTWFPMVVGSDERRYAWMDEGFNTFINYYSGIEFSGGEPVLAAAMTPGQIAADMRHEGLAVMALPDSISEEAIGTLAYNKPAAVLVLLREEILGPEVFDEGFREYIRRWSYRHPEPADFIRTMEDVSGRELDWFFRNWIYEDDILDQAVASVESRNDTTFVTVENRGGIPMPLEVRLTFADGSEEVREFPVEVWKDGARHVVEVAGGGVRNVQVDPFGSLPDVDRSNNVWGRGVVGRRPGS